MQGQKIFLTCSWQPCAFTSSSYYVSTCFPQENMKLNHVSHSSSCDVSLHKRKYVLKSDFTGYNKVTWYNM